MSHRYGEVRCTYQTTGDHKGELDCTVFPGGVFSRIHFCYLKPSVCDLSDQAFANTISAECEGWLPTPKVE